MKTFFIFGIGAIILLVLMAMIFRNMYLIVKRSEENETCFDDDNIRMMREIGIFSIALPLVGLLMSIIARLVTGNVDIEINVNLYGVFIGIIVLGLTQFFIHGKELEKEVEGLV